MPALRRVLPANAQETMPSLTTAEVVELTVPFESKDWAVFALLGLGGGVEVVAPSWLRQRVAEQWIAAAEHYRESLGSPPG